MSGFEFERKWLIEAAPQEVLAVAAEPIAQGYLTEPSEGGEVRLRRRADRCFLTAKTGSGLIRRELEVELTREQFDSLWPGTEGRRIEKTRRVIDPGSGELRIEVDEYGGKLSGLWVAEVEFPDEETARGFSAPAWFGPEVTAREEYKNQRLATQGRPRAGT